MNVRFSLHSEYQYRQRLLASTVVVLTVFAMLVRLWPVPTSTPSDQPFRDRPADRIQIEEIEQTTQAREQTPPPPAPLPPVVVPNEVVIEESFEIGEATLQIRNPEDDPEYQEGNSSTVPAAQQPDRGIRLLRNVQPNYPAAAQEAGVRARVRIEVSVSEKGRVEDARIVERWRVSEGGRARPVAELGYGLEEAALNAARRHLFRPAQHNGHPVASRTTITIGFGD